MTKILSYRDLDVWKLSRQLASTIYAITEKFPAKEQYGLTSQLRRCSISVPSNIAEGHAKRSTKDYIRHLRIALGSLAELETQFFIAHDLQYADKQTLDDIILQSEHIGRKLSNLIISLEKKLLPQAPDSQLLAPKNQSLEPVSA